MTYSREHSCDLWGLELRQDPSRGMRKEPILLGRGGVVERKTPDEIAGEFEFFIRRLKISDYSGRRVEPENCDSTLGFCEFDSSVGCCSKCEQRSIEINLSGLETIGFRSVYLCLFAAGNCDNF